MNADARVVHEKIEILALEGVFERLAERVPEGLESLAPGDVERQHGCLAAAFRDFIDERLRGLRIAVVGADHAAALLRELECGVASESAARAGDDRDLAAHGCIHGDCSSVCVPDGSM